MSEFEIQEFLCNSKTMALATISPAGAPHLVAMWFCLRDGLVTFWTFSKSQKAVNLRRDSRATILVESGEEYANLKGVEITGNCEMVEDSKEVMLIGETLYHRYIGDSKNEAAQEAFLASVPKRVGFCLIPSKIVSWDHSKLGGVY